MRFASRCSDFATLTREVPPAEENAPTLELSLLPFEEIKKSGDDRQPRHHRDRYRSKAPGASEAACTHRSRARAPGGRGFSRQRQRQQRGGVAVCAGARVRQQSSRPTVALQRRIRAHSRHVGARRAAIFVLPEHACRSPITPTRSSRRRSAGRSGFRV